MAVRSETSSNPGTENEFRYGVLDNHRQEFRLLTLAAAASSPDDTLRCTIKPVSLQQQPLYETISYVWGDPSLRATILINGCTLDVPASAEHVLRLMRYESKERVLWIDAVCINQKNDDEKGQQVAFMAKIYSNGFRNLIYLGVIGAIEEDIRASLDAVLEDARGETNDYSDFLATAYDVDSGTHRVADHGFRGTIDFSPLSKLFASAWFSRLWIVQEASLSPDNGCFYEYSIPHQRSESEPGAEAVSHLHKNTHPLPLESILKAARWLRYKYTYLPSDFLADKTNNYKMVANIWRYADPLHGLYHPKSAWQPSIYNTLQDLRRFGATDPRDHVFGIAGILRKYSATPELPLPNDSKTLAEVLRDATLAVIEATRSLEHFAVLNHRPLRGDIAMGTPSWVARWDVAWSIDFDHYYHPYGDRGCDGKRKQVVYCEQPRSLNMLSIRGAKFGVVKECLVSVGRHGSVAVSAMLDGLHRLEETTSTAVANCCTSDASIALSLTWGLDHLENPVDRETANVRFMAWHEYLRRNGKFPPSLRHLPVVSPRRGDAVGSGSQAEEDQSRDLRRAAEFDMAFRTWCSHTTIFVTEKNKLGVGPKALQEGDAIAVLFGCPLPVALRPLAEADQYQVLGICYVHGIMDGEIVKAHSASGAFDDAFHLL